MKYFFLLFFMTSVYGSKDETSWFDLRNEWKQGHRKETAQKILEKSLQSYIQQKPLSQQQARLLEKVNLYLKFPSSEFTAESVKKHLPFEGKIVLTKSQDFHALYFGLVWRYFSLELKASTSGKVKLFLKETRFFGPAEMLKMMKNMKGKNRLAFQNSFLFLMFSFSLCGLALTLASQKIHNIMTKN